MPKRFTATEKWIDPWFCSLTDSEKLFWIFILDNCNNAGIWEVNWFLFNAYVKNFTYDEKKFANRIIKISDDKWFIPKFIEFQYGELREDCKPHLSVIKTLSKYGLYPLERVRKGLGKTYKSLQEKEKDKEKDNKININKNINTNINENKPNQNKLNKDIINKNNINKENINKNKQNKNIIFSMNNKRFKKPTIREIQDYCLERGNSINPEQFFDFYEAKGWKIGKNQMKDWRAAVRTWEKRDYGGRKQNNGNYALPEPGKYDGIEEIVGGCDE